jgi:hypothetical protein
MKMLISLAALTLAATAHAGTLTLRNPTTYSILGYPCGTAPLQSVTAGFSADGNYLLTEARGIVTCGHSGRGSNITYKHICGTLQFDLSGNFISFKPINPTVQYPEGDAGYPGAPNPSCPTVDPTAVYTNAGGYTGSTTAYKPSPYLPVEYFPALSSP